MKRPTAPKWLVADDPHPAYSSWDNRDGLTETPKVMIRMDERPRIKTPPIHPTPAAEPVTTPIPRGSYPLAIGTGLVGVGVIALAVYAVLGVFL